MNHGRIQVVAVDSSLARIQLREHLIHVTHVEVRAQSKLSTFLFELSLDFCHVAEGLSEVSRTIEQGGCLLRR